MWRLPCPLYRGDDNRGVDEQNTREGQRHLLQRRHQNEGQRVLSASGVAPGSAQDPIQLPYDSGKFP